MKILVIDIGGTFIKYAHMRRDMSILHRDKIPTPQTGREDLVAAIETLYDAAGGVDGISISMPGIIDSDKGYCFSGGALQYNENFHFRKALEQFCPVPIHMENDAKCAAMAEASAGSLKGVKNGLVLLFGTMIGGGIIIDGKLYKGHHFAAGEVSFMVPRPDRAMGYDNVWGNCGGTPRLCRMYAERKGVAAEEVDGLAVFDAVHRGEEEAVASLKEFCHDIAVQIFSLQTVLDPERIAIGGGISAQSVFLDDIRAELDELYRQCPYQLHPAEIVCCHYQNDANLIGALQCFLSAKP